MELFTLYHFQSLYMLSFRERGERRKKERKRDIDVWEKHIDRFTPPAGDLVHNPGMCPDQELNQRPFGLQAGAQSTEPFQPGHVSNFIDTTTTTAANNNDYWYLLMFEF